MSIWCFEKQCDEMMTSIWKWANPRKFMGMTDKIMTPLAVLSACLLIVGIIWGFFFTPNDFRQGSTVKIFYIHVPAAMMAINMWFVMFLSSLIWLIRRHHVSALIAKSAAFVGIAMTIVALATGAIWGKPMWGTYWEWDPRLTSFLILLLFYIGYLALWEAVEEYEIAADLTAVLCLVGSVFAALSRYAVNFWNQGLHQGASLSLDKKENVADVFWYPALVVIIGFIFLCLTLVLSQTRSEIRLRRVQAIEMRERANSL